MKPLKTIEDFNPTMLEKFRVELEKKLNRPLSNSEAVDLLNELIFLQLSEDRPTRHYEA